MLPKVTMEGRLTRNPELKFTQGGAAVASFGVAMNDRKKNPQTNEWEDGEPTFLDCSVWREMAEHVTDSLHKGDLVLITGRLAMRKYTNRDNVEVTTYGVTVETIGPSLQWTGATVQPRAKREQPQEPGQDPWTTTPQTPQQPTQQPSQAPQQPTQQQPPQQPPQQPWGGAGGVPYGDEPPF